MEVIEEKKEVKWIPHWVPYDNEDYLSKEEFISLVSLDGYLVKKYDEGNKNNHGIDVPFHHSQYYGGLRDIESKLTWVQLPNTNGQLYVSKSNLKKIIGDEKKIVEDVKKEEIKIRVVKLADDLIENELTAFSDLEGILGLVELSV